jgi:hypothetical protein
LGCPVRAWEQAWQLFPVQAELQQNPEAQFPLKQDVAELQATPVASSGAHCPLVAQYFPAPHEVLVQLVLEPQTLGVPPPPQVRLPAQVPQLRVPPHPSETEPQLSPS